jgi:Carboxypeptidase regulatory-like domain
LDEARDAFQRLPARFHEEEIMKTVRILLSLAVLMIALPGMLQAQGFSGLRGRVTDSSGAVIPGVDVTVTDTATGTTRAVVTNETGTYVVPRFSPVPTTSVNSTTGGQQQ